MENRAMRVSHVTADGFNRLAYRGFDVCPHAPKWQLCIPARVGLPAERPTPGLSPPKVRCSQCPVLVGAPHKLEALDASSLHEA